MTLSLTLTHWLLAALPLVTLLLCFLKLRLSAPKSGLCSLAVAALVAEFAYGANTRLLLYELYKGLWSALPISSVIITAILLYELCNQSGALDIIGRLVRRFSRDELMQILMLTLTLTGFLQGITGFGVPVAVCAPFLIGLGVKPLWAVVLPAVGHAWGNTFGTLGLGWSALVAQAGVTDAVLIMRSAAFGCAMLWLWNAIAAFVICWFYGGWSGVRHGWPAAMLISLALGGGQLAVSFFNTTLPCFLAACIAVPVTFFVSRMPRYSAPWRIRHSAVMNRAHDVSDCENSLSDASCSPGACEIASALFPYLFLSVITVAVLLIPRAFTFFASARYGIAVPETATLFGIVNAASDCYAPFTPFTNAGFFLVLSSLAAVAIYAFRRALTLSGIHAALCRTGKKAVPSALAVVFFLMMSKVMSGCGMTFMLAQGVSSLLGKACALAAPLIGLLGTFITSSNTASNILFAQFQSASAQLLQAPQEFFLGAQTAGAAVGCSLSPGTVVLGAMMAGLAGQEGKIFAKLLAPAAIAVLAQGLVTLFAVLF